MPWWYLKLRRFHLNIKKEFLAFHRKFRSNSHCGHLPIQLELAVATEVGRRGFPFSALHTQWVLLPHTPCLTPGRLILRLLVQEDPEYEWTIFPNRPVGFIRMWLSSWKTQTFQAPMTLYAVAAFFIHPCKDYIKIMRVCVLHAVWGENQFLILLKSSQRNWNFPWTK